MDVPKRALKTESGSLMNSGVPNRDSHPICPVRRSRVVGILTAEDGCRMQMN